MTNKIVLITGGSRGLGRNAAIHLAQQGAGIVLTYHSRAEEAAAVVAEIEGMGGNAASLQLDAGDTAAFPRFADELAEVTQRLWGRGTVDALVNNAGMGIHGMLSDMTEDQFDELSNVHFKGVFFLTQRLLPMIEDGGKIVNLSSGLTRFSIPGYAAYAAMKGGVEVLTRYMAKELGPRGISVNALAPGAIETDFGGGAVRDNPDLNAFVASNTAMGRAGLPDDIGGAVAALVMGHTSWINGQRIEASGGMFT
ncbi:MAG: SDR family oxidoreductase [Pseudomonadota bacterium]